MPAHYENIAGPAAEALDSLTPAQTAFIRSLPKAELHAHLNGSIPIATLRQLAHEQSQSDQAPVQLPSDARDGFARLLSNTGVELTEIGDFFGLFPAIYALTSAPETLRKAARAVLETFLEGEHPQCAYIELRSTPRATSAMSREDYVRAVLDEVERYAPEQAAMIVSLDRKMEEAVMEECVGVAVKQRGEGRRVVGIDLCGDPRAGDMDILARHVKRAKEAGLGVTLHIAETVENTDSETLKLLSYGPDRLGHATFLNDEAKAFVLEKKTCVELCLSSNLLCKTVPTLDDHHITFYLKHDHPIVICTDDILPFRNSLLGEYALLMAAPPLGLGLGEDAVRRIAEMGMEARFRSP
ncbi:hypothetical protein HGRIS_009123 [Hohenbuehelia grisea]|uniref:Adenosine deaminase domain-containing protein n=1 Tax=Hohenbuehelia grisea TaxID=104357 RepID=A0ABR3J0J0_9AGAR